MGTNTRTQARSDSGKPLVYAVVIIIALVGVLLMLLANLVRDLPMWLSGFLNLLGVACFISGTVTLIQRFFAIVGVYKGVQDDLERMIEAVIRENVELMNACAKLGVRRLYLSKSDFRRRLAYRLQSANASLTVAGSALSNFAAAVRAGALRGAVAQKVTGGLRVRVCVIEPESSAAIYRETELSAPGAASAAARAALMFLAGAQAELPAEGMSIETLNDVVPRGTFICIDDDIMFFSPYFGSRPLAADCVIETRRGDVLFEELKDDLDDLLGRAKPWSAPPGMGPTGPQVTPDANSE